VALLRCLIVLARSRRRRQISVLITHRGGSTPSCCPYESAPVMIATQRANVGLEPDRAQLLLGGLTLLLLVPVACLWRHYLGYLS
jgi:hypothetical protein